MGAKNELDKFYTNDTTALECIRALNTLLPLEEYGIIVEPSAGSGSFIRALSSIVPASSLVAYDIAPEQPDNVELPTVIRKENWYDITNAVLHAHANPDRLNDRTIVVGNPPFGLRSADAKKFIKHAIANVKCDTIAFILPNTFRKRLNQTSFPEHWRLVNIKELPRNCFTLDGNVYHVPCSFFVWTTRDDILKGVNLRETRPEMPKEFRFLSRGDTNADFVLNGNSGKVRELSEVTNSKAEHYIKVNPDYDLNAVKEALMAIEWNFMSSCNGGVAWIGQEDIARGWQARNNS